MPFRGFNNPDIWCVVMDLDSDNNPVKGINRALFMHPVKTEPVMHDSFFGEFPESIVLGEIWPRLMRGDNIVENFMICLSLRGVCTAWYNFIDDRPEWFDGMDAFNRYLFNRDSDSSSEYDSDF